MNKKKFDIDWEKASEIEFTTSMYCATASHNIDNDGNEFSALRISPIWPEELLKNLNEDKIHEINKVFYAEALKVFDRFSSINKTTETHSYKLPDESMVFTTCEKGFNSKTAKKIDNTEWSNPMRRWSEASGRGNSVARDIISNFIENVIAFDSLSEMCKTVRTMNPGGFILEGGARAVLYGCIKRSEFYPDDNPMYYGQNYNEIDKIEKWLETIGIKQIRFLGAGTFSTALDTNGEYIVRIDNKGENELQGELPPQILKSAFTYETAHYRARIMPRLSKDATFEDYQDTKHALALQSYDFYDQKGNKLNTGRLPDGTPLVYDLGAVKKTSSENLSIDENYEQKHDWHIEGKEKQDIFFPWVADNEPDKAQRFCDYMKGYTVTTQSFDKWIEEMRNKNSHYGQIIEDSIELNDGGHAPSHISINPFEQKIIEEIATDKAAEQKPDNKSSHIQYISKLFTELTTRRF